MSAIPVTASQRSLLFIQEAMERKDLYNISFRITFDGEADPDASDLRGAEERAERRTHSQVLAIAGVTVANGGDNCHRQRLLFEVPVRPTRPLPFGGRFVILFPPQHGVFTFAAEK